MNQLFKTDDIYLAAYLMSHEIELIKKDRKSNGYLMFIFEHSNQINELENDFINNRDVPVQSFKNNLESLKRVIRSTN